jgi:hypothetical protein
MSTRGLLAFRFEGLDYVTYNHSDSYPKGLGRGIVHFAQEHLRGRDSIQAFGRKLAALEWLTQPRDTSAGTPQGAELLEAIATGRVRRVVHDPQLSRTCLGCEFAYILDLDAEVLEFWDLPERAETFPLGSICSCAVGVMECERRR